MEGFDVPLTSPCPVGVGGGEGPSDVRRQAPCYVSGRNTSLAQLWTPEGGGVKPLSI